MAQRTKGLGIIIVVVVLGILIGTALGEVLGLLLPEGVVKDFFIRAVEARVGPATLDLVAFTVTFGFTLKLNVVSVVGVVLAAWLLRWY